MKELSLIQTQQISGATLYHNGCYINVPSTGIPSWAYQEIEATNQYLLNNADKLTAKEIMLTCADLLDKGVKAEHMDRYTLNMKSAPKYCY